MGLIFTMAITATPSPKRDKPHADTGRQTKGRYYFMHASRFSEQKKLPEAFELYRKAYAIDPDNDAIAFNYAMYTWGTSNDSVVEKQCMEMMREYVDKYPGDAQSAAYYASIQMRNTHDYAEAARVYKNIIRNSPHLTHIYLELWRAYVAASMPDSALMALKRYEQAEGASDQSTFAKIMTMMPSGDTVAMINIAKQYVDSKPLDAEAWVLLGSVYDAFGRQDSAMLAMQTAIDVAPTSSGPKSEMAKLCLAQGDTLRADSLMAQTMLSTDLTTADKAAILNDFLETLVRYHGDLHRALPLIDALLSDDPENEDAWGVKLRVHWTLKEWPQALEAARQLTVLNPDNEDSWMSVLSLIGTGKMFSELDSTYARIRERFPRPSYGIQLMYAGVLAMAGRNKDALDVSLNEVRNILPDYTVPERRKPGDPFPPLPSLPNDSSDSAEITEMVIVDSETDTVSGDIASANAEDPICFSVPDSLSGETGRLSDWLQMAGDQFAALGDSAQAFAVYDQSICLNPDNTLALNNYAYYLALLGQDLDRARAMSAASVLENPSVTNIDTYAYVLFRQRNYEEAKMAMDLIFEHDDFDPDDMSEEIYEHYGDILFMLGDQTGALTNWKKALELAPDKDILQRKVKNETFFYK